MKIFKAQQPRKILLSPVGTTHFNHWKMSIISFSLHMTHLCELRVENTFLTPFNTNFGESYELHEFLMHDF
jgi:hypothetical protein